MTLYPVSLALLLAVTGPALAADRGEAGLARLLAGRTAGHAEPCLPQVRLRGSRIIDGTAIVYEAVDRTLWVNRPSAGLRALDAGKILAVRIPGSRLCRNTVVRLVDRYARVEIGQAVLGDFIPYRPSNPAAVAAPKEPRP